MSISASSPIPWPNSRSCCSASRGIFLQFPLRPHLFEGQETLLPTHPSQDAAPDHQPPLRASSWPYNSTYLFVPKPLPHTLDCYYYLLTSEQNIFLLLWVHTNHFTTHWHKAIHYFAPRILAGHSSRDSLPLPRVPWILKGRLQVWEMESPEGSQALTLG